MTTPALGPPAPAPADLIGRDAEFEAAVASAEAGRSLLLVGRWGTGVSRFGGALMERLDKRGFVVALLGRAGGWRGESIAPALPDLGELRRYLSAAPRSARPPVVFVDARQPLELDSAGWLADAARSGRVTLVIALRSGLGRLPREDGSAAGHLSRLWNDGVAARVDVGPLDTAAASELIDASAGGAILDGTTRLRIIRDSGGLPLLLKELARAAASGSLEAGHTSALFPPLSAPSPRLLDAVGPRLDGATEELLDALVLLALLDGLSESRLRRRISARLLSDLFSRDLAVIEAPTGRVCVRRLEAEYAYAHGAVIDEDVLFGHIMSDLCSGLSLDPAESLFVAEHLIVTPEGGERLPPALRGEINLLASRESLLRGRIERAFDFAIAAQADEVEGADEAVELARAAMNGRDGDAAIFAETARLVADMRWDAAWERSAQLLETESDAIVRLAAAGVQCLTAATLGKATALRDAAAQGVALCDFLLRDSPPARMPLVAEAVAHFAGHITMALSLGGRDWDFLDAALSDFTAWLLSRRYCAPLALMAGCRGLLAYSRGDMATARVEFRSAVDDPYPTAFPLSRGFLLSLAARADIALGDLAAAELLIRRAEEQQLDPTPWERYGLLQSLADLLAARGRASDATFLLADEARRQTDVSPVFAIVMAYESIRYGSEDGSLLVLIDEVLPRVEHEAIAGMAQIAKDWMARDGRALSRDRWRMSEQGLTLLSRHIELSGADSRSPSGGPAVRSGELLSEREREVSRLAGEGLSNSEIATRLFLSVRTVESHLYSARLKTGATSRRQLGRAAEAAP